MTNVTAPVDTQIDNFSALSPNKFKVVINLFPDVSFWAQKVQLPDITLGTNQMATNQYLKWSTPGDTIQYGDLVITFKVDENLVGYRKLKLWQEEMSQAELPKKRFSDIHIMVLTNDSMPNLSFQFKDTYPSFISGILLDTGQDENITPTVDVTFKHSHFEIDPPLDTPIVDSNGVESKDPSDFG